MEIDEIFLLITSRSCCDSRSNCEQEVCAIFAKMFLRESLNPTNSITTLKRIQGEVARNSPT